MGSKVYHIRLDDDTASRLKREGGGRIPEGIRFILRVLDAGIVYKPAKQDHTAPDSAEPKIDGRTKHRLDREADEKAAAEKEAFDKVRREYRARIRHGITQSCNMAYFDEVEAMFDDSLTAAERKAIKGELLTDDEVLLERDRVSEQAKAFAEGATKFLSAEAEKLKTQTLTLSVAALRGLGLFGTPEDMDDEQIKAHNTHFGV